MHKISELIVDKIKKNGNPQKAKSMGKFFKNESGGYGEGDIFIGVSIPEIKSIIKELNQNLELSDIEFLISSPIHEIRFAGLVLLNNLYEKCKNPQEQEIIVNFYLQEKTLAGINNWDLVDLTAHTILGDYISDNIDQIEILFEMSKNKDLWIKRISCVACLSLIKENFIDLALQNITLLLNDSHDLIHKASGWMLREIGKKDLEVLKKYLNKYCMFMSRTSLRYAIQKMEEKDRQYYLSYGTFDENH